MRLIKEHNFFHSLKEKLDYMVEEGYYEKEFLEKIHTRSN